ncbi:MAG: LysM peptidoglycan-binding domain-containing protein [Chloroflexi bacterium]|jgi:LysM repeat protein|nr:LysM peptidoglycan-binding domain-containing protein [Chloroflexota bacterium]
MSTDNSATSTKLCPTCGTRLSEDAARCLVCGSSLTGNGESEEKQSQALRGSRMPEITLSLPAVIGLLAVFLAIGAVMVFFALQSTGRVVEPTATPTLTLTITPSLTPTPQTPTLTPTPLPSPTPFTYTVQSGDTCGGIAAAFDISVQSIVRTNNLPADCATLFDGQELLIPYPTPTVTPFPTATLSGLDATIAACEKVVYTVAENDTLSSISTNYAVPMDAIKEFNGMVNNTVYSGLSLIIPLCERAATPGPTPTPTAPPPYPAPNLLLPPDGTHFTLEDDIVTLQWAAVGTLRDNETYAITVEDVTEGQGRKLIAYVTDTKFIVPASFRANANEPHVYRWSVMPVRQIGTDDNGAPIWDTAGASSQTRVFTWTGEAGAAVTPTP